MKPLIFFLILTGKFMLPVDVHFLEETYRRGDLFHLVSYSKEFFFYGNKKEKCYASMFLTESYARAGMIDNSIKWLNKISAYCSDEISAIFKFYIFTLINARDAEKAYWNAQEFLNSHNQIACNLEIAFYSKRLKFKKLKKILNDCKTFFTEKEIKKLKRAISLLKVKNRFFSIIPQTALFPGAGELLLGHTEEGYGAILMVALSSAGFIHSILSRGFMEFWLFPLITYYLGSINYTYRLTDHEIKKAYSDFTDEINRLFLNDSLFLQLLNLTSQ